MGTRRVLMKPLFIVAGVLGLLAPTAVTATSPQAQGRLKPQPTFQLLSQGHLKVLTASAWSEPDGLSVSGLVRRAPLWKTGVKGHLVQVVDPAEETLPYAGRVEFQEMAGPLKFLSSKTETLREAYADKLAQHRAALKDLCRRIGWSFVIHRTDEPPARTLLALHALISGEAGR